MEAEPVASGVSISSPGSSECVGHEVPDQADGSLVVLKRNRRSGDYRMTHYADTARSSVRSQATFAGRTEAINTFAEAIALGESL